jgi:hypothetical protein
LQLLVNSCLPLPLLRPTNGLVVTSQRHYFQVDSGSVLLRFISFIFLGLTIFLLRVRRPGASPASCMRSGGAGGGGDDDCGGDGDGVRPPRSSHGSGDGALTTMVSPPSSVLSWSWASWVSSTSVQRGVFFCWGEQSSTFSLFVETDRRIPSHHAGLWVVYTVLAGSRRIAYEYSSN